MPAKRTEPSQSAINQAHKFKYTSSNDTNLAKRFADMRRAQAKAEREASKAAPIPQAQLLLEVPSNVLPLTKTRAASTF